MTDYMIVLAGTPVARMYAPPRRRLECAVATLRRMGIPLPIRQSDLQVIPRSKANLHDWIRASYRQAGVPYSTEESQPWP